MTRPCRACQADHWGICARHEALAEDRKADQERGYDDDWRQGQDAYERWLDRIGENT